ncbi:hypothetical protein [Deinococcus ruber]|uniref:Uncharacterized protein n=1 Tax=Deinococcus ruber TaxID=1848197 RepID=A0A918KXK0_9DEIO|nr:hypothetical protein [Deinococcus ruber]GGR40885.1 hypothetical protein GCM10008957_56440 [Deinococcus ruber]
MPNPENLKLIDRLGDNEKTAVYRVRAPKAVHDWYEKMNSSERGQLLERVMLSGVTHNFAPQKEKESVSDGKKDNNTIPTGVTRLKVVSQVVPQRLKNKLRWEPSRYIDLEKVLSQTQEIRLDRANGKVVWRTDDGAPIRKDTVKALYSAGVLLPISI